jgi:hypothetical protein
VDKRVCFIIRIVICELCEFIEGKFLFVHREFPLDRKDVTNLNKKIPAWWVCSLYCWCLHTTHSSTLLHRHVFFYIEVIKREESQSSVSVMRRDQSHMWIAVKCEQNDHNIAHKKEMSIKTLYLITEEFTRQGKVFENLILSQTSSAPVNSQNFPDSV